MSCLGLCGKNIIYSHLVITTNSLLLPQCLSVWLLDKNICVTTLSKLLICLRTKPQQDRLLCINHNCLRIILSLPPAKQTGQFSSAPLAPEKWKKRNMAAVHAKELSGTLCPPSPSPIIQKAHFPWLPAAECELLTSWITVWDLLYMEKFPQQHILVRSSHIYTGGQ